MGILKNIVKVQLRTKRTYSSSFVKFDQYLNQRRTQAEKSILVQVNGANSTQELRSYLTSQFGPLDNIHHYALAGKGKQKSSGPAGNVLVHWVLAEFATKEDSAKALEGAQFSDGALPYKSSTCWFTQRKKNEKSPPHANWEKIEVERLSANANTPELGKFRNLSEQIEGLENSLKVSELGIRMRFFVAKQLEDSLSQFFPLGCVLPFGSTVAGIGRLSGDLDLVMIPDKNEIFSLDGKPKESRLCHQAKLHTSSNLSSARFQTQRVMETMADLIQLFVPGCSQVQRILQARVPILRFWSEYSDLQCDLSMTNSSGVHMSELIYMMGLIDRRFPSLVFAIRSWAASRRITNPVPGRQPTNFMLVLLLAHYLQQRNILPTFDLLFNNSRDEDRRVTSDGIDCTFLRDPTAIQRLFRPRKENNSLAELLFGFFEFYSEFDFGSRGVSLFTGGAWGKPDSGPLYIQNPLERHLNVARNVSKEEITRFKSECCSVLWKLETVGSKDDVLLESILSAPNNHIADGRVKMKDILSD